MCLTKIWNFWKKNKTNDAHIIEQTNDNNGIAVSFIAVEDRTIIFLEDRSNIENKARQLKLAALGRLTAAIAHEIRNPLSAISNATDLLTESIPEDNENKRLLSIIEQHSIRINLIIESILSLGRLNKPASIIIASLVSSYKT